MSEIGGRLRSASNFVAVATCSPSPHPAQLVELARPFGLVLLPPGA